MDKTKQLSLENHRLRALGLSYALCTLLQYDEYMDCKMILEDIKSLAGSDIFSPFYFLAQLYGSQISREMILEHGVVSSAMERALLHGKMFFRDGSIYIIISGVRPEDIRDRLTGFIQNINKVLPDTGLYVSSVSERPDRMKQLHHEIAAVRDFGNNPGAVVYPMPTGGEKSAGLVIQELELELYRLVEQSKFFEAVTVFDRMLDVLAGEYIMSMAQLREEVHFRAIQLRRIAQAEHLDNDFREVLHRIDSAENMKELKKAAYDFFDILEKALYRNPTEACRKVEAILKYIEQNFAKRDLSAAVLCEEFRISPGYLSRVFKQNTGYGVLEYINLQRIEEAKVLLSNTELSIEQVGEKVGFTQRGTFINAFKRIEQITPGKYRNRSRL